MRIPSLPRAALVAALAAAGAGCTGLFPPSTPVRYYTLTPVPVEGAAPCAVRFGLRPVSLPGYADRDEIVIARQGTELTISNTDLWAAPLRTEVTRTLGESLAMRWRGSRYLPHPWRFGEAPPVALDVAFELLDPAEGQLSVRVRWSLSASADARSGAGGAGGEARAAANGDPRGGEGGEAHGGSGEARGAAREVRGAAGEAQSIRAAPASGGTQQAVEIVTGRFETTQPLAARTASVTSDGIARAVAQLSDRIASEGRAALAAREPACR